MCGRYQSSTPPELIRRWFKIPGAAPNYPPRWNAAPTLGLPVVRFNPQTAERSLDLLRWGLVPHWAKDLKGGAKAINARAETVDRLPTFRDAFRRRRCIVPADGFYEWKVTPEGKVPFAIMPAEGELFGFAGVWENWKDPASGEWIRTYAIVTGQPNELTSQIHDRMPVILREETYGAWLGETAAEPRQLKALLTPYPPERMRVWQVSTRVNSVRNDGPDLLDPAHPGPAVIFVGTVISTAEDIGTDH